MLHYTRLLDFYSLKVFIETPEAIRIDRRINRDIRFRGRTLESIKNQYYSTVKPMHEKYVQPSKSSSDIVLDGTDLMDNLINEIKTRIRISKQMTLTDKLRMDRSNLWEYVFW